MKSRFKSRLSFWLSRPLRKTLSGLQTQQADLADLYFCYRLLLGRKADAEGWQAWSKNVASGMLIDELVKGFLESQEFRKKQTLRSKDRIVTNDFVLYVDPDDSPVANAISQHHSQDHSQQKYEPHVTTTLQNILQPDHVFVDVGCNIGWFVLIAASKLKKGKVIGFEPNQNCLQLLYRSLHENEFENVVIFPYAATDKHKLLQLSGHAAYGFVHSVDESDADYVQGVAIETLLQHEPKIDVVKMDIEGHEPIALQGMTETLHKHKPIVISEFHPKLIQSSGNGQPQEYLDTLARLGYQLSVIELSGNLKAMNEPSEVMNYWHQINQKFGTGDTMHLDILATAIA
ncbi:FkbM family methyltransferase [Phormidesmis sp. 146-33]